MSTGMILCLLPQTFIYYIFVRVRVSDHEVQAHHIQVQISEDEADAEEV